MPGVSLSPRDCLAQITGVLPHHLAKMEEFVEQLELLSRKFRIRKNSNLRLFDTRRRRVIDYGPSTTTFIYYPESQKSPVFNGCVKGEGVENTSLPWL